MKGSHQENQQTDHFGVDHHSCRRLDVEDHEANVEDERVDREKERVESVSLADGDADSQARVEEDDYQENYRTVDQHHGRHQEVDLAVVPLLHNLESYQVEKSDFIPFGLSCSLDIFVT